jgi:hypothetical protein
MKCTESQDRNWTREAPYYRSSLLMIISRDISLRSAKYSWTQKQNLTSKKEIEKIENTVMNWITVDSINSTFLLGGNYVNSVGDKIK